MMEITREGAIEAMAHAYRNSKLDTAHMVDMEGTRENLAHGAALAGLLRYLDVNGGAVVPKVATLSHALEAHKIRGSICRTPGLYEAIYAAMIAAAPNLLAKENADER